MFLKLSRYLIFELPDQVKAPSLYCKSLVLQVYQVAYLSPITCVYKQKKNDLAQQRLNLENIPSSDLEFS